MKPKNLLLTAALAVVLATTAACSGASATSTAPSSAPGPSALPAGGAGVTITMWHGLGGAGGKALQAEVDAFNAANAGKLKLESIFQGNYADTLAKYTSAIRDKSTPSILVTNDITTGFVYDAGQTVSAQSMAAANPGELNLQQLRPAARNYYSANGQLLAVPLATSMPLLYVNTAMLAKAHVQLSTLSTLAGVAAAARAVHAASPSVAGIVQPFDGWWFEQLTAGAGQPYCTPDSGRTGGGATAVSLTTTAQKAAFGTMASLYVDGVGLNTGTDGNAALTAFSAGKVAMMLNSSGAIGGLTAAGMKGYEALPYPISGPAATSGAVIGGAAMWVDGPGHSPAEQVASWKAITYLASAQAQERFSQASGYAPINTAVDSSPTEKAFRAAHPSYAVLSKQFAATPATTATAGCLSGAMTGIRASVVTQMQSVFSGATSLEAGLSTAQSDGSSKISDYRKQAGK